MGTKKFKISHQRDKCIGCGSCVQYVKNCWRMNTEDGKADLVNGVKKGKFVVANVDIDELKDNQEVARACPMQIIKISESE